jgi:hypothetical protein
MSAAAKPPAASPSSGATAPPHPDPDFAKNIAKTPLDELQRWAHRHVAWSRDGTRIVAGAETLGELFTALRRAGVDPSSVVFDFIEIPGVEGD